MKSSALRLLVLVALVVLVSAWTPEDHEIFRIRDEVLSTEGQNVTFYDFLGVKPSASQDDIVKSYRKKAKTLHPDKVKRSFAASNAKPGKSKKGSKPGVNVSKGPSEREIQSAVKKAEARYARMGVVRDILTGPGRDRYDHFLKNGFPRWKGTGYYYSRFRPGLGTVLLGLFVAFGGAAHYGALVLGWKRQREFVDRYIRHARRAAWGDELGIRGIPGVDSPGAAAPPPPPAPENPEGPINRRQKRMMDRENRKEAKGKAARKGGRSPGTATPTENAGPSPSGEKKRVVAENGKVLVVDSIGNVFLEEENEDGAKQEFLLDIDEIQRPTMRDTMLFRVPAWFFQKSVGRFIGGSASGIREEGVVDLDDETAEELKSRLEAVTTATQSSRPNGTSKRKGKRSGQKS